MWIILMYFYFKLNANEHIGDVISLLDALASHVGKCRITYGLF